MWSQYIRLKYSILPIVHPMSNQTTYVIRGKSVVNNHVEDVEIFVQTVLALRVLKKGPCHWSLILRDTKKVFFVNMFESFQKKLAWLSYFIICWFGLIKCAPCLHTHNNTRKKTDLLFFKHCYAPFTLDDDDTGTVCNGDFVTCISYSWWWSSSSLYLLLKACGRPGRVWLF